MIKVKDGYAKLIGENLYGDVNRVLLSNGGDKIIGNASGNIPINNGTINTNLNADTVDSYHMGSWGHYKYSKTVTDTTNAVWYVKIVFNINYNSDRYHIHFNPAYNNINGRLFFSLSSYDKSGYLALVSTYNGCNIKGFYIYRDSSASKLTMYLKLAAYTSATCTMYSTLEITSATVVSAPSVTFIDTSTANRIYTDMGIAGPLANTLTFAAGAFSAKTYDNSAAVTVNIPTHTSHLTNNSGFLTQHQSLANYVTLNTDLTITGKKNFQNVLTISNSDNRITKIYSESQTATMPQGNAQTIILGGNFTHRLALKDSFADGCNYAALSGGYTKEGTLTLKSFNVDTTNNTATTKATTIISTGASSLAGLLSINGDLWFPSGNTNKFINFTSETNTTFGTNSWRLGYLGAGSADTNYFMLQSTTNTSDTWSNAFRITNETLATQFYGSVTATKFIKSGGTSSQFLKADGSVDSNTYATTTLLGLYLPLTGGTLNGPLTIAPINTSGAQEGLILQDAGGGAGERLNIKWISSNYGPVALRPNHYYTQLLFYNGTTDYTLLHSGNYSSYLPVLNSASTHATSTSVIYAPSTAGTKNLVLLSNGSGEPVWANLSSLSVGSATNWGNSVSWTASTTVGSWSRILTIEGYANVLLSTNWALISQASLHLYLISIGYGTAKVVQLGCNNYPTHSSIQIRIIKEASTKHHVEVYNSYGYSGATTITVACRATNIGTLAVLTTITANTAGSGSEVSSLTSSHYIAQNFHSLWSSNGIFYIEGTGTTAGTWLGSHAEILSYYAGLTIAYKIPVAGASTTTLNINGLGAKTCYYNNSNLSTHYPKNTIVILVYDGTNFVVADYNYTRTDVRQYLTNSTNSEYPLLFRYNTAAPTSDEYVTEYTRYNSGITINPSTNTLKASIFNGALGDGTMNLYALYTNEINFGGSAENSTIYFGYRATDSKPIPTEFVFGRGLAALKSGSITVRGSIFLNTGDATLKVYSGKVSDSKSDGSVCFLTCIDNLDGETHLYSVDYPTRNNIILLPRGGQVYIGHNPGDSPTANYKLNVGGKVYATGYYTETNDRYKLLRSDGGFATFTWSGQSGLPNWVWGGNGIDTYYIYNPANFKVALASKLATARTLWGLSFDGTANISGSLSSVTNIAMSGRLTVNTSIEDHSTPMYLCIVINCDAPPEGTTVTNKNAPGIGFHISTKSWASLVFTGTFRFINSDTTTYADVAANKFIKADSSNSYVLLGGGGHKLISEFSYNVTSNSHDCNNLPHGTHSATYRFNATPTNAFPGADYGNLLVIGAGQDTMTQIGAPYNDDALYFRRGTWYSDGSGTINNNAWKTILHDGNSSVSGGGSTWGSSITVNIGGTSKTLTIPTTFSGYYVNPVDLGTLFKHEKSFTDTTNAVWYIKVVFDVEYNNKSIKFTVHPKYNNTFGAVYFTIDSYAADRGITVKTSRYNGNNCTGYYYNRVSGYNTLWLQFTGDASAVVTLYSTLDVKSWEKVTPSGITFVPLTHNEILTNYNIKATKLIKSDSSDSYVLLGGGGHKALSDFVAADGGTSTNSNYLAILDIRGTDHLPNSDTYPEKHLTAWFNKTGTPSSAWYSGITVKGWTNDYATWLLCGISTSGTATSYNLYFRHGINDTWDSWKTILDSSNSSVSKSGETLSVKINGTTQSLTNTDTTYSAGTGLSLSGTTFNINAGNEFPEGSSNLTDGTLILTSYASNSGFDDTNAVGTVYKRNASCIYGYIKGKLDSVYQAKGSYLTSHQTIYNLTLLAGQFSAATFDPNGSAKTVNIPTHTSHLTNDSGFITNTTLNNYLQKSGGTMTGSIITPKDDSMGIIPDTDNYGLIGSSTKKFYRMYASTFYGNLSGTATKATLDADGNNISDTYFKYRGQLTSGVDFNTYFNGSYVNTTGNGSGNTNNIHNYGYLLAFPGAVSSSSYYSGVQIAIASDSRFHFRVHWNYAWSDWARLITTNDIDKYLPLSGGTMTGAISMGSNALYFGASNNYFLQSGNDGITILGGIWQNGYFHANNYLKADKYIETSGYITAVGSLSAESGKFCTNSSGAYWSSDRRLKDNINSARNLNIDSLIKEFDWKDTGKHSWGFIALELLEVLPEAVNYNEDTDRYSVNYDVAHSAAIASLNAKIKLLELRIKELEDGKASNE